MKADNKIAVDFLAQIISPPTPLWFGAIGAPHLYQKQSEAATRLQRSDRIEMMSGDRQC